MTRGVTMGRAVGACIVVLALTGCGSTGGRDETGAEIDGSTESAAALVPFCHDVPPPGPVREGDLAPGANIDDYVALGAIDAYIAEHPNTYAGKWIDRAAGGTFVVAFTDDPAPHLEAILARRASPDDPSPVEPRPEVTDDTTVGESSLVVDVVRVDHSAAALAEVQATVMDLDDLGVIGVGSGGDLNRVVVTLELADEAVRAALAEATPQGTVCVEGPSEPIGPPVGPVTLLPAAGAEPMLTCDSMPFPASALDGPTGVEAGNDPAARALVEILDGPLGEVGAPQGGWRELARDDGRVLFAAGDPPEMATVVVEREGERWVFAGSSSGCTPRIALPEGIGEASWVLDPDHPAPAASTTELHVLVTERACTGAAPIGDRLVGPDVRIEGEQVVVAFAAESPGSGFFTCPGNPPLATAVALDEPLGDRTLADGSTFPPTPVG